MHLVALKGLAIIGTHILLGKYLTKIFYSGIHQELSLEDIS